MTTMAWYTRLRALDGLRFKFDPLLRRSYQNSSLVLGVAPYVKEILKGISLKRFATMTETGILSVHDQLVKKHEKQDKLFKLLYVGRIIRTKGVRDLVRAFKYIKANTSRKIMLDILGDGDDREKCETEAKRLAVQDHIIFHGKVTKETVFEFYQQADLFVFPSFREPSGNVVLEAMSFGLPMIVCSKGGPGYTVKNSFGVKIDPEDPETYPQKLAAAILDISKSRSRLEEMREAALREAMDHYLWPSKINAMIGYYNSVLSREGM
jgi:glycosyltransferase involved in cell wall biosynthesis